MKTKEINARYQELLINPSEDSVSQINVLETETEKQIRAKCLSEINASISRRDRLREKNRIEAWKARIIAVAFLDADDMMHDYAKQRVEEAQAAIKGEGGRADA